MRTTVRIDDELMRRLKEQAHREGTSLTKLINRVLRCGMVASRQARKPSRPYRQKTFRMGQPKFPIDKALAFAAALEDEEVLEKLARRK
jgi:predicted Zn-ribbon and HTH transcriptional regulator